MYMLLMRGEVLCVHVVNEGGSTFTTCQLLLCMFLLRR